MKIETRLAEWTGCPVHPDETALVGTLTPPDQSEAAQDDKRHTCSCMRDSNITRLTYPETCNRSPAVHLLVLE